MFDIFEKLDQLNKEKKDCGSIGTVEYIVVGLGNPESKYDNTRHNVGFMSIDYIAKELNVDVKVSKFKSLCATTSISGKKVLLMKPQTFMNSSGDAIVPAMAFYKVPIENVIVIFDDISLDVGKIRIRRKGSAGGHNGIKSIISLGGKNDFPRIKMGVGKKPNPKWDLKDWVLSNFSDKDKHILQNKMSDCYDAITLILEDSIDKAMNKYN